MHITVESGKLKYVGNRTRGNRRQLFTSRDRELGFVRISKCGTQSFIANVNLTDWVPFGNPELENTFTLASIRQPAERFLSSIFETLYRATTDPSMFTGDVHVSERVYADLLGVEVGKAEELLESYIELIKKNGWFDAHHEPQVNFLLNEKSQPIINPVLFPLQQMNSVIDEILQSSTYKHLGKVRDIKKINVRNRVTERLSGNNPRREVSPVLQRLAGSKLPYDLRVVPVKHPLYRLFNCWEHKEDHIGRYGICSTNNLLREMQIYYSKYLVKLSSNKRLEEFINDFYENDIRLFDLTEKNYNGSVFSQTNKSSLLDILNL